jgi:hypothetical protein
MKTADITTTQVLFAVHAMKVAAEQGDPVSAPQLLSEMTLAPNKVVLAALEREVRADNLDYGSSVNRPFLTPQGFLRLQADMRRALAAVIVDSEAAA